MRREVVLILLAVVAAAVVGTSVWLWLRPDPEACMAEFVAELRARGEPVTIAEMDPPMPAVEQNGAHDLERAFRWLQAHLARTSASVGGDWSFHHAGPWDYQIEDPWHEHATPEQLEELRELLATMGPFFEDIATATSKTEIAWPPPKEASDPSICGPAGWDSYRTWRRALEFVEVRAILATEASDRLDAVEWSLAYVRRLRLRTETDRIFETALRRHTCTAMRDGVESGRIDAVALRSRVDGLLCGDSITTLPRALRALRVQVIELFPTCLDGSSQRQILSAARTLDKLANDREPSRAEKVGDAVDGALAGVRFDWRAYLDELRAFDAVIPNVDTWSAADTDTMAEIEKWDPGIVLLMRSADAADSLARVALATCQHRATHGDWPQSCADLAPLFPDGVPTDPYTNAPFDLSRDGDVLVLQARPPSGDLRDQGLEWRLPPR